MSVYYYVVNYTKKEYLYDPNDMGVKWYVFWGNEHPMGRLLLYILHLYWNGDQIAFIDEHKFEELREEGIWMDITKSAVEEYREAFSGNDNDPECMIGFERKKETT